jgi:hypothetical protein
MSLKKEKPIYEENLRKRFNPLDSQFHCSQQEIELFAAAVGVDPSMVQVNQQNGELELKPNSKPVR